MLHDARGFVWRFSLRFVVVFFVLSIRRRGGSPPPPLFSFHAFFSAEACILVACRFAIFKIIIASVLGRCLRSADDKP